MNGVRLLVPMAAIEIIAVLGQSGKVAYAEVAAAAGPILIVGSGFAKIVITRPYKLADDPWLVLLATPVVVGKVAP